MSSSKENATSSWSVRERKGSDVRAVEAELFLLPVQTRVPLKFGAETLTSVTCARARLRVRSSDGRAAEGWGETPLSVQWVWPSELPYADRLQTLVDCCRQLAAAWADFNVYGHPLEVGDAFRRSQLTATLDQVNADREGVRRMPYLAALTCCSAFDIALHDAYGNLVGQPVYETYGPPWMNRDLSHFLQPADGADVAFQGLYPRDFLRSLRWERLPVWHLVGGLDPLSTDELSGSEPHDGYPVLLDDWIRRDGLKCLKIKLRGNDFEWDFHRVSRVGRQARALGVEDLTTDFNCTVEDPAYVQAVLDRLQREEPDVYEMILYVEQPFPYDLEAHPIDVSRLAQRKPLLMDESADSWSHVQLGRSLGWNGVALKTCKTQTGAILSLCWAKAHQMHLMVQDLTNPMLAQIPHVQLAAHADTMRGVESNAMQFYPEASSVEAGVHPGLYQRRRGELDLSSVVGPGFGYRLDEIERELPDALVLSTGRKPTSSRQPT
ncbi:MAG: mandelate racemase/muconate lactonizing enzyme family protein [Planctomycetota bacterium]